MAAGRKYADLPDLDAAPEIYETPELTDDVSTIQANTLPTESPTPSDDGRHDPDTGLDRQRIDQDEARRRFEPALVGAKDVNFSDQIAFDRKSYASGRRRRRRRRYYGAFEADSSSASDEETVPEKLARLRIEAEELRLELEAREKSNDKTEDSQEDHESEAVKLCRILDGLDLSSTASKQNSSIEARFAKKIAFRGGKQSLPLESSHAQDEDQRPGTLDTTPSTMAAIAACSDRLTALESTLGLSALPLDDRASTSILPTIKSLSKQLSVLSMTLAPTDTQPPISPIPTLDTLTSRIKALTADADKLTVSRKSAMTALTDLHEARLRYSSAHRPGSSHARHQQDPHTDSKAQDVDRSHAELFLDSQSVKIDALYQTLPTIHRLSPLLPLVLDRLRSLSVIHTGAAEVKSMMDQLEANLAKNETDIAQWRQGVEHCEKEIMGITGVMEHNVNVVGTMVRDVEERVDKLRTW